MNRYTAGTMIKNLNLFTALAALLLLAGCASKEPMDYLPEAGAYLVINPPQIKQTEGGKRLVEAMEQAQGGPSMSKYQIQRMYLALEGGAANGKAYGVSVGSPGMPQQVLNDMKAGGGREQKMAGRTVVTTGPLSFTAVGETGLLFFRGQEELDQMIRTSKKKSPSAGNSSAFATAKALSDKHAATVVADAAPLLGMAGGQMPQISKFHPKGAEALQQVKAVSLTLDWETQPDLTATMHLPNEGSRKDLSDLVNMGLSFVSMMGGSRLPANAAATLKQLKATTSDEGVVLNLKVPPEEAEKLLTALKSGNLPRPGRR